MGSAAGVLAWSMLTSRCSGHQSRFRCPRVPVNGHLPALSSVFASMVFLRFSSACSAGNDDVFRQWLTISRCRPLKRSAQLSDFCPDSPPSVSLSPDLLHLPWKISNIRSSRIVLSSRSVYLIAMITLRQLRYLSALTKHGHFGRAAEACAVTQPALSMQIRDLERTLGVAVVERRPGDVILTDVGREIARRGEDMLAASLDLIDFARHRSGLLTGRLTLGAIPSLAPYLLPRILPLLQRRFPDLQLELRETQTRQLVEDIKSGVLDAALLALPVGEPDIDAIALFEDLFLLAVPSGDPRAETATVAAEDIDQNRLILLEDGHCLRDQALAFCATARGRAKRQRL